jgi:hypothetical protein
MTRKDYELIARVFAGTKPNTDRCSPEYVQWQYDVQALASELRQTNSRFDRARFVTACGVE